MIKNTQIDLVYECENYQKKNGIYINYNLLKSTLMG